MMPGNPFWLRVETPDPNRHYKREKEETERAKKLKNAPPTIFDVERYFVDTDRAHFVESVGKLNTKKIENALLDDLDKAESPEKRMRLRALLQVATTNGYLRPETSREEITKLIHGRIRTLHWEYARKLEAGDDVESEERLMAGWRRIAFLVSAKNEIMDDEEMLFIEEILREMRTNLEYLPNSRQAQDVYEKLRKIRTAMYFKALQNQN